MVIIIAITFALLIIWGIITSSHEASEIEEKMMKYEEPEIEIIDEKAIKKKKAMDRIECIKFYADKLESWKKQNIITDEQYEEEKKIACGLVDEIKNEFGIVLEEDDESNLNH